MSTTRKKQWSNRTEKRIGIMLHIDESTTDKGSLSWFSHPDCGVSYNRLIQRSGQAHTIAPLDAAAYHAGVCRSSDPKRFSYKSANSAFYGLALSANSKEKATPAAKTTCVIECIEIFQQEGWGVDDVWRITTHRAEACYPQKDSKGKPHPFAGKRGRKNDPEGPDPKNPVLDPEEIRRRVGDLLRRSEPVIPAVKPSVVSHQAAPSEEGLELRTFNPDTGKWCPL